MAVGCAAASTLLLRYHEWLAASLPAPSGWPWPERHRDIVGHWSDSFNFLDLIPGPPFLLFYVIFTLACALLCYLFRNRLLAIVEPGAVFLDRARVPFNLKPDFIDLAYLRGGHKFMLAVVACNLHRLGLITGHFRPMPGISIDYSGVSRRLTPLELAMCDAARRSVYPWRMSRDPHVVTELRLAARKAREKLRLLGFLPTLGSWIIMILCMLLGLFLVDGLAIVRHIRSEIRGYHNLLFLDGLAVVAAIAVFFVLMVRMRQSRAGADYLKQLSEEGRGVLRRFQPRTSPGADAGVIYALAACGMSAASGTIYGDLYDQLNPPRTSSFVDSCSSCSGGSCGGGGCGGGGCGGGGCGGG